MIAVTTKRIAIYIGFIASVQSLPGCSSMLPELVPFGAVTSPDVNRSANGLGVHRKMWELSGAKVLTPQKLSPRLDDLDVIVLVGQSYGPPGKAARTWLENWLGESTGRSVIYFGRDFDANLHYLQSTLNRLPTDEVERGEIALASAETHSLKTRIAAVPESTFCSWFYLDLSTPRKKHSSFSGPWADSLSGASGSWPVGITLQPPASKWRSQKPSWLATAGTGLKPANQVQTPFEDSDATIERSAWSYNEINTTEAWNAEFRQLSDSQTLLASEDGQPLIFQLTNDRFEGSQILVITNGAPLLNASLVEPLHRKIGEQVIEACLPAKRVALLAYDERGILIAQNREADSRAAGLEMLTVWPLSAITMPAALLGIIICAVLLPILGRPQTLRRRSTSDFGLHIAALGRMLFEARDISHARNAISEYFTQVRRESPPAWLDSYADKQKLASTTTSKTSGSATPWINPPPTPSNTNLQTATESAAPESTTTAPGSDNPQTSIDTASSPDLTGNTDATDKDN